MPAFAPASADAGVEINWLGFHPLRILASNMNPWWILTTVILAVALAALHARWRRRYERLQEQGARLQRQVEEMRAEHDQSSLEQTAQQEALFNSMTEGVLLLDASGRIQLINRSLQRMFTLRTDVRGQTVLEAFRLRELGDLLNLLASERTVQGYEMELPGMQERWLQVNAAAVQDRGGRQRGAIMVFHDLTRIRELENTRQEFVANVSHELRTPLSLIKGYVETLLDGAKNDPELAGRFLLTIEKHTDRLTYLIEDILTISKLESGQIVMNMSPVGLRQEVDRVLEDLKSLSQEKKIQIQNEIAEDFLAQADAGRLEQVFFNLIENAIKYGSAGGLVRVGGKKIGEDKVELWVADDGPGIPLEAKDRVFERFYRVDRARSRESGGTGLGLSIVKHIVQSHGGEVWVDSEVGRGTSFHFTLPCP